MPSSPSAGLRYSLSGKRVFVAGHSGLVGSAIARRLGRERCTLLTASHAELDLRQASDVDAWMRNAKPDVVVIAAATVGGIEANRTRPVDFLEDNLLIVSSLIASAHRHGVGKLVFLSSSCVYPRLAPQPIAEASMLTGELEPTNQWYAVAKIAGQKLCDAYRRQHGRDYISIVPASIYGPGDNFDLAGGHVLPSLLRRFHEAKAQRAPSVTLWGTGSPIREFLFADDLADAVVFLTERYSEEGPINVGAPSETTVRELAETIARITGYEGRVEFDTSKPDGMPRKVVDPQRLIALGWTAPTPLSVGLEATYRWLVEQLAQPGATVRGWSRA